MKLRNIRIVMAFIPNILSPVGLYMAGDPNVLGFKMPEGKIIEYHIPQNKKGSCIILNEKTTNPFYLYINQDKEKFTKIINPPAGDEEIEKLNLISASDKKLLGIMHYLLVTTMPNRRYKLKDTQHILKLLENAVLLRTGGKAEYELPTPKWKNIKDEIEELIMTKELLINQSKVSLTPVQTLISGIKNTQ